MSNHPLFGVASHVWLTIITIFVNLRLSLVSKLCRSWSAGLSINSGKLTLSFRRVFSDADTFLSAAPTSLLAHRNEDSARWLTQRPNRGHLPHKFQSSCEYLLHTGVPNHVDCWVGDNVVTMFWAQTSISLKICICVQLVAVLSLGMFTWGKWV